MKMGMVKIKNYNKNDLNLRSCHSVHIQPTQAGALPVPGHPKPN